MSITTNDLKNGYVLDMDGELVSVVSFQHVKPGKGGAFVRTKLKSLRSGAVLDRTFRAGEKVERVTTESRAMQLLYLDGDDAMLMDTETFDQLAVPSSSVENLDLAAEGTAVMVLFAKGDPIRIELPNHVELLVAQTDPGVKGDTVSNVTKSARLETGASVNVPLFVNEGDRVKIDTRTRDYLGRA